MKNSKLLELASLMTSSNYYNVGNLPLDNCPSMPYKFASKGKKKRQMYRHKLHK